MYDDEEVIRADRAVIIVYPYGRRAYIYVLENYKGG